MVVGTGYTFLSSRSLNSDRPCSKWSADSRNLDFDTQIFYLCWSSLNFYSCNIYNSSGRKIAKTGHLAPNPCILLKNFDMKLNNKKLILIFSQFFLY